MEQSLQELARKLLSDLERLDAGQLSVEEVAPLTDAARDLYERLIALRYVAIERTVKGEEEANDRDENDETPFRLTPVLPGQTSLIDAIEEVIKSTEEAPDLAAESMPNGEAGAESAHKSPSGREAETEAPRAQEPAKPAAEAPEPPAEPESKKPEPAPKAAPAKAKPAARPVAAENTVAERLRRTPIEDLRKAIGLNQKFQFINDLFKGDSTRYNLLIDEVNSAPSLDDALALLGASNDRLDSPDDDDKVALTLLQLVERRFL